ncbi:GPN-loop GTPase 1 [Myotis brandtii]|uniref:GPN-loop GTPase 1 n=1 Tax=Myotis brandtii TaxID=109478 RepID=S7ME59_MYOBR|nr:GPN-loop GTPase 1 [Myotis brandtii]
MEDGLRPSPVPTVPFKVHEFVHWAPSLDELFMQVTSAVEEYEREYRSEYEHPKKSLACAQSQQQKEQLERLQEDMGSVALDTGTMTDGLSPVSDPSQEKVG